MNTIKELIQQEKYNTMLKRKNREIKELKEENTQISMLNADLEIYLKEHKARIDKAIEQIQIDKNCIDEDDVMQDTLDDLLDILKGSDTNAKD